MKPWQIIPVIVTTVLSACNNKTGTTSPVMVIDTSNHGYKAPVVITDTLDHGYNELANPDKRAFLTTSDYNKDNPYVENIERPLKSTIEASDIDTALLFNVWAQDTTGPHADFVITKEYFDIADYDGDSRMPYRISGKNFTIYYNDFIQQGEIISLSATALKVKWKDFDEVTTYVRWPLD